MKRVINRKMYNTETATMIGQYWNGIDSSDFRTLTETLYKTKKGEYFLHGSGGPLSKYSAPRGSNGRCGSENIIVLTKDKAIDWAEENEIVELFEENGEFADVIEEA